MPRVRGQQAVEQAFANTPKAVMRRIRGAGRAAGNVIADGARERCISSEVRSAIKVRTKVDGYRVTASVVVAGDGAYIAPWLEYGTSGHFISVADEQRKGMSVRTINDRQKEGSLVIGGNFVSGTVWHPGAQPHPFLRPALDTKGDEAVAAAQRYLNSGASQNEQGDEA